MSDRGALDRLDPTAVAMTTDDARAGRSEAEWAAIRDLAGFRRRWREIYESPPSPERSEFLRRGYESTYRAYGRRDWELNTLTIHPTEYTLRAGAMRGLIPGVEAEARNVSGYLRMHQAFLEAWTTADVACDGVLEAPDGRTVGLPRFVVRGGTSGAEVDQPFADVHTWRDGWLVEQVYWFDREEGLRSTGIDPALLATASGG
jgi:hypothetical protein